MITSMNGKNDPYPIMDLLLVSACFFYGMISSVYGKKDPYPIMDLLLVTKKYSKSKFELLTPFTW